MASKIVGHLHDADGAGSSALKGRRNGEAQSRGDA